MTEEIMGEIMDESIPEITQKVSANTAIMTGTAQKTIPNVQHLIRKEKNLSFALRTLYICFVLFFIGAVFALFIIDSQWQSLFLAVFLGGVLSFVICLYMVIVSLLKTHREIARNYQQIFSLENVPSFLDCKEYFKGAGFLVYEDENVMIANKLLIQKNKGYVKRDYLIQVVVTSKEICLDTYFETHQDAISAYAQKFQESLDETPNKLVKVGAYVHYVEAIPKELAQEFKIQAQQRYLLKFDMIIDETNKKLYYPSHIESYKERRWCGQLLPAPYDEVASFAQTLYLR